MTEQLPEMLWDDIVARQTRRSHKPVLLVAYLYVGDNDSPMASLHKSNSGKWHVAHCDLPGLELTRRQGPVEEMKILVAGDVARWLRLLGRTALRLTDGAGI